MNADDLIARLRDIRERHTKVHVTYSDGEATNECTACHHPWPCDVIQVADALEAKDAEVVVADRTVADQRARIAELEAEAMNAGSALVDLDIDRREDQADLDDRDARIAELERALRNVEDHVWEEEHLGETPVLACCALLQERIRRVLSHQETP